MRYKFVGESTDRLKHGEIYDLEDAWLDTTEDYILYVSLHQHEYDLLAGETGLCKIELPVDDAHFLDDFNKVFEPVVSGEGKTN